VPGEPEGAREYCSPPQLAEELRNLFLEERNGCLTLSRSGVEKRIIMDRGMIVAASSSLEDETLPAFLAGRGIISADAAQTLKGLDDRLAAEALMKRRQVSHDVLQTNIRDLAFQILSNVFRWEEMAFRFDEGPVPVWPVESNVLVSFELIIRAMRSMAGFAELREALLRQERTIRFSEQVYFPFDRLALSSIEGYIVSRIDGATKIRDILVQVPESEERAAGRFLFGLLILGLAQFQPPISPGMLRVADLTRGDEEKRSREDRERQEILDFYGVVSEGNVFEVLGLQAGAELEQIRSAYQARKERFDSGRFLKTVQSAHREQLQIIEARLLEAYLALRSLPLESIRAGQTEDQVEQLTMENVTGMRRELTKSAKQSEADDRARVAEQFAGKARDYWKLGDMFNCIRYCEFAMQQSDRDAATSSLMGQALARNPDYRWQKRAEAALTKATEIDPYAPDHWIILGEFYVSHGLNSKARKQFDKALEISPSHPGANEALAKLGPPRR
jgi:tetratricopeptide (TPR) repeat protein